MLRLVPATSLLVILSAHPICGAEYAYSQAPEAKVLEYRQFTTVPYYDGGAYGLTVHGDGRVVAFIHEHFSKKKLKSLGFERITRRGEFETRMTPQRVAEVLTTFEPLFLFDEAALRTKQKSVPKSRTVTDGGEVVFAFDIEGYSAGGKKHGAIRHTVTWPNLSGDARLYPDLQEIQDLNKVNIEARKWVFTIAQEVSIAGDSNNSRGVAPASGIASLQDAAADS